MKARTSVTICAVLAVSVLLAATAVAVPLPFADGFETIPVGYYPTADGWQTGLSGASAYVSNAAASSGTRSFRLQSLSFWSRCDYVRLDEVPDRTTYQASLRMDQIRGRSAWVGLARSAAGQILFYDYFILTNDDGVRSRVLFSGVTGAPPVLLGTFAVNQWVTLQADLDFVTGTADLWVDDVLAAGDVPIQPRVFLDGVLAPVAVDRLAVGETKWTGSGNGVIYVDDVAVFERVPPTVEAVVDLDPNTLNLKSRGQWVTCYIELPADYFLIDIDQRSLLLNGVAPCAVRPVAVGDHDYDGIPDLMVKFDRALLATTLTPGDREVTLTGCLVDDTPILGSDTIRVLK